MNLAIIGATGNVGRKTIEVLEKSEIEIENLYLVASKKSAGKKLKFKNKDIIIEELEKYDFSKAKFTIFAAGSEIAKTWAPSAAKKTIVIDNSKYFRMNDEVPLVVAEVNPNDLKNHKNIISNPNCSTIQLMLPLKPLHDKYRIKRVIVSTYQAVSGAGKASVDELFSQTKDYLNEKNIVSKNFSKQMAFNLIPHIDVFVEDGYTKEEWKMENETKKILDKSIGLSATFNSVKQILSNAPGCKVIDDHKDGGYITPLEAEGEYLTYISRIRKDHSNKKALNIWVVADNLLKGAALNTVQIVECLVNDTKK